jgi:penicillin-binding protein 1A
VTKTLGATLRALGIAAVAGLLLLALYALALVPFTPAVDRMLQARNDRPSVLLAADGSLLATYRRGHREWIALDRVPKHVVEALVATEDHRFWAHNGIDWRRSLASALYTLAGKRQGGSTITQQLARNLFPEAIGRAPTLTRKLKEMITAIRIERAYAKREILEAYLNTVSFHYNANGIEMAARTYFDKPAEQLTLLEGATLIGMLKGTRTYNPVLNPARARERRNLVLAQMVRRGMLDVERYERLRRQPLRVDFERRDLDLGPAPHFAEAVRRFLLDWCAALGYDLYADGLVVHSTLDPALQGIALQAVARQLDALQAVADVEWASPDATLLSTQFSPYRRLRARVEPFGHFWRARGELVDAFIRESPEYAQLVDDGIAKDQALARLRADGAFMTALRARKTRLEAGFVALDPRDGAVRAWVGARDFALDRYDHVQQARRQPGSTFKPFVYGAALEAGVDAARQFQDRPVAIRIDGGGVWRPGDAGGATGRMLTLEEALAQSRNTVTAQLVAEIGARRVAQFAQRMGVRESPLDAVPSLALGTSPVTLLEMVSAYATIAAQGERRAPRLVTRIADGAGRVLADFAPPAGERVLAPDIAIMLTDMLRAAVDRGTARGIRDVYGIVADVAGKTGTTQNNTDGWFVLMHSQLIAGAWVGFNDPRVRLRSDHWGQGAHNALHVVGDFMRQAIAAGAIDARAKLPRREGAFVAALRHFGQNLRRWFGLEPAARSDAPLRP